MTHWPSLPLNEWRDTYDTLHMWAQIVGKVRMNCSAPVNHWWHSSFFVTPRGLSTSTLYDKERAFEIQFDLMDHRLVVERDDDESRELPLKSQPVATFYKDLFELFSSMGISVAIDSMPQEFPNPIPFDKDFEHRTYDPEYANRLRLILAEADRLMKEFRSSFIGKCSPVQFFWGSFDLAVTRFSGRKAPERPGADLITREAYSHEVSSCGFWPGSGNIEGPAFYAYFAPEPEGYRDFKAKPKEAFYNVPTKGYILMYEDVRNDSNRDQKILDFFKSTYSAGADLAHWDRANLEIKERVFRQA